jgi:transposase
MKFVTPLNEATRQQLYAIYHDDTSFKCRLRAHAVLLSDRRYTIDQLAGIFDVHRDTVSIWLTNWEERAFDGLSDAPRLGRPRKTSTKEDAMILRSVERHPQQSRAALSMLKKKRFV